jgi:hypothetical protein
VEKAEEFIMLEVKLGSIQPVLDLWLKSFLWETFFVII